MGNRILHISDFKSAISNSFKNTRKEVIKYLFSKDIWKKLRKDGLLTEYNFVNKVIINVIHILYEKMNFSMIKKIITQAWCRLYHKNSIHYL
jgi:hypothetical protein